MNGQNLDGRNITVNEFQSCGGGGGGFRGGSGGGYGGGRREGGGGGIQPWIWGREGWRIRRRTHMARSKEQVVFRLDKWHYNNTMLGHQKKLAGRSPGDIPTTHIRARIPASLNPGVQPSETIWSRRSARNKA
ncbi:hypothetical protein AKJ16_DCAP16280 [Drosera capensis]